MWEHWHSAAKSFSGKGQNAAKLAQRTRYVATRPGVELLADERSTLPATKKGCSMRMHT